MTTKQEILAYAKQNGFVYPSGKIMLGFMLLGGATGGVSLLILDFIKGVVTGDFDIGFNSSVGLIIVSVIFGFIPATITGAYLVYKEFFVESLIDYIHIFLSGLLSTIIYFLFLFKFTKNNEVILVILALAILGGISSIICGKLFLPKLPKGFEK